MAVTRQAEGSAMRNNRPSIPNGGAGECRAGVRRCLIARGLSVLMPTLVLSLGCTAASATTTNQSYASGGSQAVPAVAGDGGYCALLKDAKVACRGDQVDDQPRAPMTTATVVIRGGSIAERTMSAGQHAAP